MPCIIPRSIPKSIPNIIPITIPYIIPSFLNTFRNHRYNFTLENEIIIMFNEIKSEIDLEREINSIN